MLRRAPSWRRDDGAQLEAPTSQLEAPTCSTRSADSQSRRRPLQIGAPTYCSLNATVTVMTTWNRHADSARQACIPTASPRRARPGRAWEPTQDLRIQDLPVGSNGRFDDDRPLNARGLCGGRVDRLDVLGLGWRPHLPAHAERGGRCLLSLLGLGLLLGRDRLSLLPWPPALTPLWVFTGALAAAGQPLTLDTAGPTTPTAGSNTQDVIAFDADGQRTLTSRMLGDDGQWPSS